MPAASLAGAAVVVVVAVADVAGRMTGDGDLPEGCIMIAEKIERMLLGALPFTAQAAGPDIQAMDWTACERLQQHRFAGVGVAS